MNEIWIVLYTDYIEENQILGAFDSKDGAKLFIGNYVLENEVNSALLFLTKEKVEVSH